jgi:hypothetical protein
MTAVRALSMRISELFTLFDESIQRIPDEHKGPALAQFCTLLKKQHKLEQREIDEGVRMLLFKEDYTKGFVGSDGVIRRKEVVATRTVPVSQGEEIGGNGLLWRDRV